MGLLVSTTACYRQAEAQETTDPLAPIDCFEIVDARGVANTTALALCRGATSTAPGICFADALDRGTLTQDQGLRLCRNATSTAPIACFDGLAELGTLTHDQMIDYCATRCPLGPAPPESSDPGCLAAALTDADLSTQTAGRLCERSRSPGPVECFVRGETLTLLTQNQLVLLCAQVQSCQYVNALPVAGE